MSQDFQPGMQVSLDGEFGVVLDHSSEWDGKYTTPDGKVHHAPPSKLYGYIQWDTEVKNDVEDWCGLFGSFLDSGGKILDEGAPLKYIDAKGNRKN